MADWMDRYRADIRAFLELHGTPVDVLGEPPYEHVSSYSWLDFRAARHILDAKCSWMIAPGSEVRERTYSEFNGTFATNNQVVGLDVDDAACRCGKYPKIRLRFDGTLSDVMQGILGVPMDPSTFSV